MENNNLLNELWPERYRPRELKDLVLPEDYMNKFLEYKNKKEIPDLLFVGSPGSGKTTCARILTSVNGIMSNPDDNLLAINGSAKETRGISFVSEVIEPFFKVPPSSGDKYRIVFIDESDYLTAESLHSIRAIIEKYSRFGRFILTGNYISKYPEAILSRFQTFIFKQIPIDFILSYCQNILKDENVKFKDDDLKFIIDSLYPDVRRILHELQRNCIDNILKIKKDIILSNEKIIISNIIELIDSIEKNENYKINNIIDKLIQILTNEMDIDFRNIYTSLFNMQQIPIPIKIIINKYANEHLNCLVPSIHFSSMIFSFISCLQSYNKK